MTTDLIRTGITEKQPFLRSAEKCFYWQKTRFAQQKHPQFLKRLIFILEKGIFFFEQLFPLVIRTWLESRGECLFLGPKSWFLANKSDFCHTSPILVNSPFVALGEIGHFPPWDQFFNFWFPSYGRFRILMSLWNIQLSMSGLFLLKLKQFDFCLCTTSNEFMN